MYEYELFVLVVMFFVFLYVKSRIDELKDQINNLQVKFGSGVNLPAAGPESVLSEVVEAPVIEEKQPAI